MIKNINKIIIINALIISLLTACHADEDDASKKAAQADNEGLITGVVKETMDGGGYTYISLSVNGESKWIAGPKTDVAVGSTVTISPPMPMNNFKSEALKREFKIIYFTGKIVTGDGSNMKTVELPNKSNSDMAKSDTADPHAGMDKDKMKISSEDSTTPNEHVTAAAKKSEPLKGIKKAENGKTIDDILKQKKNLDGKSVKIRGKVIKYTEQVMNKNWIHIKDSSTGGDLTITTDGKAEVGDTIVVDGKIAINKDFGYGYLYDVILEDAKVTIE